jgi:hypothetical protein
LEWLLIYLSIFLLRGIALNNSQSSLVSVQVNSSRGGHGFKNPVEIFGSSYFAVSNGFRYAFKIQNLTSAKLLVVGSVDGKSIVENKDAELSDSGYIINPHDEVLIHGFRIDDNEVGAFLPNANFMETLVSMTNSDVYKIGCVAFAIFREKQSYQSGFKTLGGGNSRGSGSRSWGEDSIGTSVGQSLLDKVTHVNFDRESNPVEIIELNYRPLSMLTQVTKQFPDDLSNIPFSMPKTGIQNYQITK